MDLIEIDSICAQSDQALLACSSQICRSQMVRADLGRDLIEMELHGFAVAGWQHQRGSRPKLGTDRTEQIGRLGALIVNGARARALSGPAIGQLVLLPDAHLVLEPDL